MQSKGRGRAVSAPHSTQGVAISQPIDPELAALRATIASLIEAGDGQLPNGGAGPAVDAVDETTLRLAAQSERLLSRAPRPSLPELEELLAESCSQSYILEAQRLRTRRRMVSALADASPSAGAEEAREELRELVSCYCSVTEELERVEVLITRLRAGLEKMRQA